MSPVVSGSLAGVDTAFAETAGKIGGGKDCDGSGANLGARLGAEVLMLMVGQTDTRQVVVSRGSLRHVKIQQLIVVVVRLSFVRRWVDVKDLAVKHREFSRLVLGFFKSCQHGPQLCGWPVLASLFLKAVVNLLKCLFALTVTQDIASLGKYGSILLEFNRNFSEVPSLLSVCHEIAHAGKQGFENCWLVILLDRINNHWLQFLPAWL